MAEAAFKADKNISTLKTLALELLTETHTYDTAGMVTLWEGLLEFDALQRDCQRDVSTFFDALVDILEEQEDPGITARVDPVPFKFLEDAVKTVSFICLSQTRLDVKPCPFQAHSALSIHDVRTLKLWLLLIYHSVDKVGAISDFLQHADVGSLTANFLPHIPVPQSGTFIDGNLQEDALRSIRYKWTVAEVLRQAGHVDYGRTVMVRSLQDSVDAAANEDYLHRRGIPEAVVDLVMNEVRILESLAEMAEEAATDLEAVSYMSRAAALQLTHRRILDHSPSYMSYLHLTTIHPSMASSTFAGWLQGPGASLHARYQPSLALHVRIRTLKLGLSGQVEEGCRFLSLIAEFLIQRLATLPGNDDGVFEQPIRHSLYKVAAQRLRISSQQDDNPRTALHNVWAFISTVREHELAEHSGDADSLFRAAWEEVVTILRWLHAEGHDLPDGQAILEEFLAAISQECGGEDERDDCYLAVAADFDELCALHGL